MKEKKKFSIITEKDVLILRQLLEDGRKSSSSISKEIDLGREIVNYRIKRLIKENLIVKFIPKINESALAYQEYIIFLKLNLDDEVSKDQFIKQTIGSKYLVWTIKSESGWDFIIRLYSESIDEFKEKLSEILELFSDVLANYYTIISSDEITERETQTISRNLFENISKEKDFKVLKTGPLPPQIDQKDKEILHLLEEDGRVQYKEIADKLSISSDTVKYRIDRMKEQGIIENFVPIINFNKLGLFHYAAVIRFSYLDKTEAKNVADFLKENSFVVKAIKSLNNDEYFITLVFNEEKEVLLFKDNLKSKFDSKIQVLDIFSIE